MNRYLTKATTINWDLQIETEMCDSPCWRRVVAGKLNQCSALIFSPRSAPSPRCSCWSAAASAATPSPPASATATPPRARLA